FTSLPACKKSTVTPVSSVINLSIYVFCASHFFEYPATPVYHDKVTGSFTVFHAGSSLLNADSACFEFVAFPSFDESLTVLFPLLEHPAKIIVNARKATIKLLVILFIS